MLKVRIQVNNSQEIPQIYVYTFQRKQIEKYRSQPSAEGKILIKILYYYYLIGAGFSFDFKGLSREPKGIIRL